MRRACWEGLRTIGDFVLANGFVELVAARNKMAKALGYADFYDYKVTQAEGFGKVQRPLPAATATTATTASSSTCTASASSTSTTPATASGTRLPSSRSSTRSSKARGR